MEFDLISNPLYLIFKLDSFGILSEEIEDPSKIPLLYNYILESSNKKNKIQLINIINIIKEIIKRQRSICSYFLKYNNKSIYIFLFELFLKENNMPQIKTALTELLSEISINIQISKDVFNFIFQKFSKLYRKEKNFLINLKNMNYTFNDYFLSLLELLHIIFSKSNKEKILPSNYFSCFGNNSFNLNFNKNNLDLVNYFSLILNFKISKSKIIEKNPQLFGKCRLITINLLDNNKSINVELKYPNNLFIIDGDEEIKVKTIPSGDWVTLIVTFSENKSYISTYFSVNGDNMNIKEPLKIKNIKLKKEDKINSITFFDNFYGEVTSIVIFSQKNIECFNIFSKNIKYFSEIKKGLWDRKHILNFIKYTQNINYSEKKRDKGGGNLYNDLISIFSPINNNSNQPKIIEDCFGRYLIEINGNVNNHKYYQYQRNINQICSINNFIPIAEMFIIYQNELLNDKNLLEYLKLISKIVYGRDNLVAMNKYNFFKLLGLILEKLPNQFFNKDILNVFENIGNNILEQNIKDFYSDFFEEILLNEKIILKFNDNLKSSLWNKFLQLYLTNKQNISYHLNTKKLCNILLHYDVLLNKNMCCEFHLNMYKEEFIGNMNYIQPNLNLQLISLKKLINEHLLTQNIEKIQFLVELLILDLSPCMAKLILEILINIFNTTNKNEEWKKNIILKIVNDKYSTIIINLFNYSLPDVRYEILTLLFYIYISLLKQNNVNKFSTFENMIKTCLLPNNIFCFEKSLNILSNDYNGKELNSNRQYVKTIKNELILNNEKKNKEREKENSKKENNNKKNDEKQIKRNSIFSLAEKFESKNKNKDNKNVVIKKNNSLKLPNEITKIFETKKSNVNFPDKNKDFNNNKDSINQTNPENINIDEIKQDLKISKEDLIIKNEIYDLYIEHLYNFLLQWCLGIQMAYNSSLSTELFSSFNNKKEYNKPKNNLIMNMNILEILFILNKNVNDFNFTLKLLNDLEQLIEMPENSYFLILNNKIYLSFLDITFKYYNSRINNKENELLKKGKKICINIFLNVLKYLKNQHKELPMNRLELFLLWGNKNINHSNNEEEIFDFIHDLLLELLIFFKKEFKSDLKNIFEFNFEKESQIINNFYFKNYLVLITFIFVFSLLYKSENVIRDNNINSFFSSDLNINIPDIFISGMRFDKSKGNNINEYWKDFHLIENVLNEIEYIFEYYNIKKKAFDLKSPTKQKDKEKVKDANIKYDKYIKILNKLIFDTNKRNLFYKELYIICFFENNDKNMFFPLIKIISMVYINILSEIKNINKKNQFIFWLNKYKNLLRFLSIASINLNKNKNETESFNIIQNICFEIISSGLCFLYNLYETSELFKEEIKNVINNIFLLCFSILKIYLNKKLFINNSEICSLPNAILILFNEYIKDQNKIPFINLVKLDKTYLNPENKIFDLIKNKDFEEVFFQNKNLKSKLYQGLYSISNYKNIVDKRYKLIMNLEDKLDYSYKNGIHDLLSNFEKESLEIYNNKYKKYIKNRKEYKRQKQKLFGFIGMWGNRELFYGDIDYGKIKYKVMNHYSKNLMRPLIKPIFDINYYLPEFPNFKKENLFIQNNSKENNDGNSYDLILDFEYILKISNQNKVENKAKSIIKDNNDSNQIILREQYYKSDLKYYSFLEKISRILKAELFKEDFNDDIIEMKPIKEDYSKINNNKLNERKTTTITQSTRVSTIKESKTHRGSFQTSFINLSFDKEKGVLKNEEEEKIYTTNEYATCCLVKSTHHIKGLFYIKNKNIRFKNLYGQKVENELEIELNEKDDNFDIERGDCYGSYFKKYEKDKNLYKISINMNDIKLILKKKYYYKNSSIEIFTGNNKSYFFNFNDENTRKVILDEILIKIGNYSTIINNMKENNNKNNIIGYLNNKYTSTMIKFGSKKNIIKLNQIVKLWKNWEISNFEFLMLLNIFSNRSYLDITQYPIFPWILTNYEDPLIKDLFNESLDNNSLIKDYSFRDLSLPMGMLTINEDSNKRILNYSSTFKMIKEDESINKPYYYGCNYSNPAYISNYLIRLFPYTQACIEIQGNGFDTAQRLFISIIKTFKNATTQSGDVRELIPEFFYLPEMFLNINKLNLGTLNDETQINDVITPCRNNPYEFTSIMRYLLESQKISNELNEWIDLIFGIKARDKEAEIAKNLYREESYQEDINLDEVEDKITYLKSTELGLIPNQLFNIKELDKKEPLDNIKKIKQITDTNYKLKYTKNKKISNFYNGQNKNLFLMGIKSLSNDKFIFVYNKIILEKKIWYSNKDCGEDITLKKQIYNINKISYNSSEYPKYNTNIKIIHEGKIILIGGFYDGKLSIIINESDNNQLAINPFKDESIITSINTDFEEKYLFIGNNIGNISIMLIESDDIFKWKEIYFINDQMDSISCIETNYLLNVWVSASIDNYINLYTLPQCKLIHSFKLDTNNSCNNIFISDSPLPSILIICQEEVYLYSINGHKIYYQKEYSKIINPILIKDFIKNDFLAYITNGKEISIRNVSDFTLITNIEIDREIYYLFPNENNKVLYATNKSGSEINALFCDNKK